jgi:hypothetical protein
VAGELGGRGWRPEYSWSGTVVVVNGREVTRYAMIRDEDD